MSIATYGELKTAVATWLNRSDLSSVIPDFIALAETDIRQDVRVQAMEQLTAGTLTGETLAHPTRFLEARRLIVKDELYQYVTPTRYTELDRTEAAIFTSIGQSFYILDGAQDDTYSLLFYQAFAAFSVDADTNWLLTNAPDIYLSAACRHGASYLKDTADEQRFAARYAGAVARLNAQQNRSSWTTQLTVRAT